MSKYTTGEIARLCGVSVRTVQYYDSRNILVPGEYSEGGRRLYSEQDLRRMKIICFLRDAGMPINSIGELLSGQDTESVISALLEEQELSIRNEMTALKEKMELINGIRRELKGVSDISVDSIGDIAYVLKNKKKTKKIHTLMLILGIPVNLLQWMSVILWITHGYWWLFLVWVLVAALYGGLIMVYYRKRMVFICPRCHSVFKSSVKEIFWAKHTPRLRKLTCPVCNYRGYCVETCGKDE